MIMRRTTMAGVAVVALLAAIAIPRDAHAYSIVVDGDPSDWPFAEPPSVNLGHLARGSLGGGSFIWLDATGDERTDFATPDPRVDLTQVRLTADSDHLYILVLLSDLIPSALSGDGAPMVVVGLDFDVTYAGNQFLPAFADTLVYARWERAFNTRLGSGNNDVLVSDEAFQTFVSGQVAADAAHNAIEISVPWSALGLSSAPQYLRFTLVVLRSDFIDQSWDIGGPGISNALDVISNYGVPGTEPNTWQEVADQIVDYSVEVHFEGSGEPIAPVLIHEVLYDPSSPEPGGEFIEIVNRNDFTFDLGGFKVGDEGSIGSTEGMQEFPTFDLRPGHQVVFAVDADQFFATYGFSPNFSAHPGSQPSLLTSDYAPWASGGINLSNSGDEVIILDTSDTVIDVVTYGSGSWPSVFGDLSGVPEDSSLERVEPLQDTDNVVEDFEEIIGGGSPFNPSVFADGFESGDVTAWTTPDA